jgi:hypothetical protein
MVHDMVSLQSVILISNVAGKPRKSWQVKVNGINLEFNALTVIDRATNLMELMRIERRRRNTSYRSIRIVGWRDTRGQKCVCITTAVNS